MRILVAISPQLRPHSPMALASLRDQVIRRLPSRPDLIAWLAPSSREALDELADCCTPRALMLQPDPQLPETHLALGHGLVGSNRIGNNLLQWLALKRLDALKRGIESEQGPYDLVIWTRPDLYFVNALQWNASQHVDGLWISPQDNWLGYNDRFCFGSSAMMSLRWSIYDYFVEEFQRHRPALPQGFNAEIVLAALLHDRRVRPRRTDLIHCRIRDHDAAPWLMLPVAEGLPSQPYHPESDGFDARRFDAVLERLLALQRTLGQGIDTDARPRFVPLSAWDED